MKNKQTSSGWVEAGKYQKQLKDAAKAIDELIVENANLRKCLEELKEENKQLKTKLI